MALRDYQKCNPIPGLVVAPVGSGKARNRPCKRCSSPLIDDRCTDATCPFHYHSQSCMAGFNGHPEIDPYPDDDDRPIPCTCEHTTLKTFVCEFCGVYNAMQPRCNKCEEER